MHLKYTKIVNKSGQVVLVGCDRAGSYVNRQFVFIYLDIILLFTILISVRHSFRDRSGFVAPTIG